MTETEFVVADRNTLAFLIASGHLCHFVINSGRLEGLFQSTPEFQQAQNAFVLNSAMPVQNFIAASKLVSEMIRRGKESSYGR